MRIVIDMQGAQTESRFRGIGRYTMSFAQAVARNRGEHEIILALNGLFPDTIEPIRAAFNDLSPQENIRVWHAPGPVKGREPGNKSRHKVAGLVYEAFLASLRPDVILVSSLFEGYVDDGVTSIGRLTSQVPTALVLYDLIPYIHRKPYLEDPVVEEWYFDKLEHLRRANLWLAISESSRREGIHCLGLSEERSINISTDADKHFRPLRVSKDAEVVLRQKYGLNRPFVMYTGGIDHRKNIERLICAFSNLPAALREENQLAIVCSIQPETKTMLMRLAAQQGLNQNGLVLTGFVPEDDLVALYNLCRLFVFPSIHEGFGLPALEAMRCGAPVIGANTSSLPEVIGWKEALFDPHSEEAMCTVIGRALSDDTFRADLVLNGKTQAKKFSWEESARRAVDAMERFQPKVEITLGSQGTKEHRPRLAYISPLPPEKSGIADYSAELLPELARFYEIDVIVDQDHVSDNWITANCPARSIQYFLENASSYDRVIYHFGNSEFHKQMFGLIESIPGVVVLHDFFLSSILAYLEHHGIRPGYFAWELYNAHGYAGLYDLSKVKDITEVAWEYPCSLSVIQGSLGVIVHSPNSLRLAEQWYGHDTTDWSVIPLLRDPRVNEDKIGARKALGFAAEDFLICAFGILGPSKLNQRLLRAYLKSRLASVNNCHLIFVGENHTGNYGRELLARIKGSQAADNIRITGWADKKTFRQYLNAADVGVQLRTLSRGETSGAVLDCMNHALATIVNANGSMADLDEEAVWKLPDEFTDEQLIEALETLWQDDARRRRIGEKARDIVLGNHSPKVCARQYAETIERFYGWAASGLHALPAAIADIEASDLDDSILIQLSDAIARSFPFRNRKRQLLVDVSILDQVDARDAIQRAVFNILKEWLKNPPFGYRVEPVYSKPHKPGYCYARHFTLEFLGCPSGLLEDEPIEFMVGDIFLGLDLQPDVVTAQKGIYQHLRQQGVRVKFVVYDLLCLLMPEHFVAGVTDNFTQWLEVVSESDGAVCISKTVANELTEWIRGNGPDRLRPFKIDWFHLGADIENSHLTKDIPQNAEAIFGRIRARPSFLMVGTLEPRKGHAQVFDAFNHLWGSGVDANLIIVGKQGWLMDELIKRLRAHPELNKRLFWLEGISDEYLEKVYSASTCLIAASYGEGFGLPLIEAAQHKLPIIARDIPVFREVAGEHAYYFDASTADDLAQAIREWLALYQNDRHPKSDDMPWLTWKESAAKLFEKVIG